MRRQSDLVIHITESEIAVGISLSADRDAPLTWFRQSLSGYEPPAMDQLSRTITHLVLACTGWSHWGGGTDPKKRAFDRDSTVLVPRGFIQKCRVDGDKLRLTWIDLAFGLHVRVEDLTIPTPALAPLMLQLAQEFACPHSGKEIKARRAELRRNVERMLAQTRNIVADICAADTSPASS